MFVTAVRRTLPVLGLMASQGPHTEDITVIFAMVNAAHQVHKTALHLERLLLALHPKLSALEPNGHIEIY